YQAVRRLMEVVAPRKKGEPPEEDSVLMNACHSLEKLNVRQAVPALVEIARGGKRHDTYTEEVRAYATSALGGIGGQDAQKALRKLLKDNSMLIRSSARKALGL
ncbi:MAG: HEAT repeat domain-containing protein, partial [Actinomycetia bacterium]|nr:HEAT repeat domain-containing protein [Actinomycetes bacterium]